MTTSTENFDTIENYEIYLNYYENSQYYTVFQAEVLNYGEFLSNFFDEKKKQIKIMKTVMFEFFPNGDINAFSDYSSSNLLKFNLVKYCDNLDQIENIKCSFIDNNFLINNTGISLAKRKDILSLFKHMNEKSVNFYTYYLAKIDKNCNEYFTDSDINSDIE